MKETVGRYMLIRRLATGGMAEIFLARLIGAAGFEKEVVLKRILPQFSHNRDFVAMLIDEAKIAVGLNHPHIVPVHELARDGDVYYIVMDYVRGWDLRRILQAAAARRAAIPPDVGLAIFDQVLDGLAYAHERKVVHRDISPQNILISEDGTVKIADFGIARAAAKTHVTATGVLKGKFAYMSPEQASPEEKGKVDGRSDLFSTAVVLYETLTGERLFYRGSDLETLDRVRRAQVTPSPRALEILPQPLWTILLKALERDPRHRYATAGEFRDALRRFARAAGRETDRDRLKEWLPTIFEEETELVLLEETRTVGGETLVERSGTRLLMGDEGPLARPPGKSGKTIAALIVGAVALYAAVGLWLKATRTDPPAPPAPPAPETRPLVLPAPPPPETAAVPPPSSSDFEKPPVITLPKGFLTVRALPWGTVKVDGGRGREAPVRLPLAPGRHAVRVTYEPDGSSVSGTVVVPPGKEIVCVANFRGGKELRCGR